MSLATATAPVPARRSAGLRRRAAVSWLCLPRRGWAAGLLAPALGAMPSRAQEGDEAGVKAAFLVKFLGYVDWPAGAFAGPGAPQVIAVLDDDAVLDRLSALTVDRRINDRPVAVRALAAGEAADGVHLLYVGRGAMPAAATGAASAAASGAAPGTGAGAGSGVGSGWLPAVPAGQPMLVVTDAPGGMPPGSMLNFVNVLGQVRFDAAPAVAAHAGLKLSARLLAVANKVAAP